MVKIKKYADLIPTINEDEDIPDLSEESDEELDVSLILILPMQSAVKCC